jgi:hypothetical protein
MKPAWDGWAWVCKIVPIGWKKYLGKKLTPVELAFNPEGADEDVPPTSIQIASAEVAAKDEALVEAVSSAIRARYAREIGKRRLEAVIELQEMFVQPIERDGVAFVGFGFSAEWDREHGLGVLTHGTRVLEIGGADVAFLTWMAERHVVKKKPSARKPAPRQAKPVARKKRKSKRSLGGAARPAKPAKRSEKRSTKPASSKRSLERAPKRR